VRENSEVGAGKQTIECRIPERLLVQTEGRTSSVAETTKSYWEKWSTISMEKEKGGGGHNLSAIAAAGRPTGRGEKKTKVFGENRRGNAGEGRTMTIGSVKRPGWDKKVLGGAQTRGDARERNNGDRGRSRQCVRIGSR